MTDLCTSFEDLPMGVKLAQLASGERLSCREKDQTWNSFPLGECGTRLEKLDAGDCVAVVLAYAGLYRLNLLTGISSSVHRFVPTRCRPLIHWALNVLIKSGH